MIAVILPTADTKNLSPLTDAISESLLPIANKPILEHQIEFLAQQDIKEIVVILKHKHLQVEKYFGCGEKWGVKLKFVFVKQFEGAIYALKETQGLLRDSILCLPGHILTNPDLTQLLRAHKFGNSDVTLCCAETTSSPKQMDLSDWSLLDKTPFIIESKVLSKIPSHTQEKPASLGPKFLKPKIGIFNCKSSVHFCSLNSTKDYWEINQQSLEGKIAGLIIKGKEISKNIWVGAHSEVHPKAILKAPVVIGDHCVIHKDAVIEKGSIIGDNSIIEEGASVSRSVIWKGTYAGAQTKIADSVVNKNQILNVPRNTMLQVSEPFILGDSEPSLNFKSRPSNSLKFDIPLFSSFVRLIDKLIIRINLYKANLKLQKRNRVIVS